MENVRRWKEGVLTMLTSAQEALLARHKSDCAVHNEPAFPNGPCSCGANPYAKMVDRLLEYAGDYSLVDGDVFSDAAGAIATLSAELKAAREDRDAWRDAMQDMTPGGSEFTTPAECLVWARRLRQDLHATKIRSVKTERRATAAEDCLKRIAEIADPSRHGKEEYIMQGPMILISDLRRIHAIATEGQANG